MRKDPKSPITKLSEKFDKQLLNILSAELKVLKQTKNQLIQSFLTDSNDDKLMVA